MEKHGILGNFPSKRKWNRKHPNVFVDFGIAEQEEIAKSKPSGESLTREDLAKMKYTWRVVLETLRMFPPVFGGFRNTLKDIEYNGYLIPKGWQVRGKYISIFNSLSNFSIRFCNLINGQNTLN